VAENDCLMGVQGHHLEGGLGVYGPSTSPPPKDL